MWALVRKEPRLTHDFRFYADLFSFCLAASRAISPIFEHLSEISPDLDFYSVDVDAQEVRRICQRLAHSSEVAPPPRLYL